MRNERGRRLGKDVPIVVLTGAGISAESGLATFRGADGLWEGHRIDEVATPEAFRDDPELVHRFYNARRRQLAGPGIAPNAAHLALARLERAWTGDFLLVTQNVDDLHERAGMVRTLHMHGQLGMMRCLACDEVGPADEQLSVRSCCGVCGSIATLRPDVVWFGEMPRGLGRIYKALETCGIFIAIGTSGQVYPAAGFVEAARAAGAWSIEVNLLASAVSDFFDEHWRGLASEAVPALVDQLIGS
ncbi:NAD-dependent deacetylase [Arboricoccus pini]|uniref:NAD-dependent protein deacylase n=1 Tax=Arboricoccus pini TaxID=1963835 RepID=A0A212QP80_9PROT|nr:NAD-dependent deacylase [Arboricoccus pini]SNB61256.1 NAD-dependent deacetylase [Arboricoccus pini]